ncbi:HPr(Ser) kinase/phosphatase, partial [bacterium]|nr:HPr(Ser) kinase/phosphatase [bacterium]
QVFGKSEVSYLTQLSTDEQELALGRVAELKPPLLFITSNLQVPQSIIDYATEFKIPLLRTKMPTVDFLHSINIYLEDAFADRTEVHGSLVDVYGVGMLFTGNSGIGKSECALDLVERGHRLVADDIVEICRRHNDVLIGTFREILQHKIEIRGVGVVDVQAIFGVRGIRMQKRIEVEVRLEQWQDDADYERIGLEHQQAEIMGIKIPRIVVPIYPGKNITVISEVIALDLMLKLYGVDAAQDLNKRIMDTLKGGDNLRQYLRHDHE